MNQNLLVQTLTQSVFSPAVFDFWAGHINPIWSWQRPLARIITRKVITQDCIALTLKPNRHVQPFIAGQHLNITLEINGVRLTRSYSPSLEPDQSGLITITVKRMVGGKVSNWLHEHAKIGQVIELGAPFGEMTLAKTAQQYLFLAAGSGITPFISLIREWAHRGTLDSITLVYWAKTQAELCFVEELNALTKKYHNFQVHFVLTQEKSDIYSQERINPQLLNRLVSNLTQKTVYACGPAGFVAKAQQLTANQARSFHGEAFSFNVAATPAPNYTANNSPLDASQQFNVLLTRSQRTLSVPIGQTLLAALEAQGIRPASGCRMGLCNTCACIKQSGTTEHIHSKDRNVEAGSSIRICVSSASSDLSLDL